MNPEFDGIHHINVYSKGKTSLGRFLSNFTKTPIEIPNDGKFNSIEGYWYWLGCTHEDKDILRDTYGIMAKQIGRKLNALDWQHDIEFKQKIKNAIFIKLTNNPIFFYKLKTCKLQLMHYYVYNDKAIDVPEARWIIDYLESFKNN